MVEKLGTKENFAVKAFNKKCAFAQPKGREAIINEIDIMRNLDHENCLKLYEVFETENSLYLIMEYMQGLPLSHYMKKEGKMHENEALKLLKQILLGIQHMNSRNIMHRDLKPDNIIFKDEKNTILGIVDFGLSMRIGDPFLFYRCGTPGYVAPEIANFKDGSETYGVICDIFSAGVIFHQMLLHSPVFRAANYNELLQMNRKCEIDFTNDLYKWATKKSFGINLVIDVLQLTLEKDPKKRISVDDLLTSEIFHKKEKSDPLIIDLENIQDSDEEFFV